jgi:PAS domain S-box-containing protein
LKVILEANLTAGREIGVERDRMIGSPLWSFIVREDRSVFYQHLRDVFKTESRVTSEVRVEGKAGQNLWVRLESVSVSDPHGKRFCRTSLIDMTDRKQAEEALKKAHAKLQDHARELQETNRELEGVAYTISHDLRAPLRAINGFARILVDDFGQALDEEAKRRLAVIEKNAIKMGLLIDDLLAFSRAGRTAMNISRIDMSSLVAEVVETLKSFDAGAKADIHVAALPAAQGDLALIRQVLANLLENAVKFSRNKSDRRIEVGSFERDGKQGYFVRDNGVGFDTKYNDKIFGVFQRLVTDREFEGTGVGLAIVHRLVTRHGGRVWAESRPGEGATFYFTLPGKSGS